MDYYNNYSSGNMGTAFLDNNMQSTYAGTMPQGSSFGAVMSNLSGGINQSAGMGVMPGASSGNISPQQLAAQMQMGGPTSVLPYLAGGKVAQMMFPIAGVWSLVDGVKAYSGMRKDAANESKNYKRFDQSELSYGKAAARLDSMQTEYNYY